jgi:serine/threonine protein kinase
MLEQISEQESPSLPKDQGYDNDLCDFIDLCLKKDSHERPSAITLLAHPFILKYTQS